MASWRGNLRQASFRGVGFQVESHESEGGRRTARHEYPLRDTPFVEDLGRKARSWIVEAFVLSADYMAARDQLIAALEQSGPGTLVHPYLGTRSAQVDTFRVRESLREGGMARISVTFLEPGKAAEPDTSVDTGWAVSKAAATARSAARQDFSDTFTCAGHPEWVRSSASSKVLEVVGQLRQAASLLSRNGSSLLALASSLESSAASQVSSPSSLASGLDGLVYGLAETEAPAETSLAAALSLASALTPSSSDTSTASRAQELTNANAIAVLARVSSLAAAAVACSEADFVCRDDAVATRDTLAAALDAAASTAPDSVYQALADLRVAVVRDVNANGANLASLTTYTSPATLPALVLAQRIYGDATRADEIVSRNKVSRPGAVPGGTALEVLADV